PYTTLFRSDRLADGDKPLPCFGGRDGFAIGPLGLFGIPLNEGSAVIHFGEAFRQRLTAFHGHGACKLLFMSDDEIIPFPYSTAAVGYFRAAPGLARSVCMVDCMFAVGRSKVGNRSDRIVRWRVNSIEALPVCVEFAVDVGCLLKLLFCIYFVHVLAI